MKIATFTLRLFLTFWLLYFIYQETGPATTVAIAASYLYSELTSFLRFNVHSGWDGRI